MLCAQLSDWKDFRAYQEEARQHYVQRKVFGAYEARIRERRQTHGLGGDVELELEGSRQSPWQTWIEFQDYHLQRYERSSNERSKIQETASLARGGQKQDDDAYLQRLESIDWQLRRHESFLRWTEEQRYIMYTKRPVTPTCDIVRSATTAARMYTLRERRPRRISAPQMGKGDISGPNPKAKTSRSQHTPGRSRKEKIKVACLRPEVVSATRSASVEVRTRSGRVSRRPRRWGLEM